MIAEVGDMLKVSGRQNGNAVRATKPRQDADNDAEHNSDDHEQQIERLHDDGEAMNKITNVFQHFSSFLEPRGKPRRRTPGLVTQHFLKRPLR